MIPGLLATLAVLVVAVGRRPPPRRDLTPPPTPGSVRRRRTVRRRTTTPPSARDWARYLDAVAAHIRGGTGVRAAAMSVADEQRPAGSVVRTPLHLERLGDAVVDDPDEAVVVQSLLAALQLGAAPAAVAQSGANVLRERAAVRAEALAHSAQARLSARVLTLVPVAFAAWSAVASTTYRRALVTPTGLASASLGALANTVGWWWMRRIVRRAAV